jgi:hypothetical protein
VPHGRRERADDHGTGDLTGQRGQVVLGRREHLGEPRRVLRQQPAGRREPGRPPTAQPRPVEQRHAGLGLQPGDVLRHPRRGQVQHRRGREDPTGVGHRPQHHQPARIDSHSVTLHAV